MNNNNGWIKLYRDLMDKPIWTNSTPEQCKILITLLMMANHKPKKWEWRGEVFEAEAGQFVTSAASIIKKAGKGISRQNVRTALEKFKKYDFLTYDSTTTGLFITIVNWEVYQSYDLINNQPNNQSLTKAQPKPNQELTTNKNVIKKEENISEKTLIPENLISIAEAWNSLNLNKVICIKGTRLNYLNARIEEYGMDKVIEVIKSINESDFLKGKNDKEWMITFDWLIKSSNFVKVLEGNYKNRVNSVANKEVTRDQMLLDIF